MIHASFLFEVLTGYQSRLIIRCRNLLAPLILALIALQSLLQQGMNDIAFYRLYTCGVRHRSQYVRQGMVH